MKMTRLRNEIMADIDTFEGDIRVPDRSLGREDLEHWMKGKNYLSMTKFQYVDRYILEMARKGHHDFLFYDLIMLKEIEYRKVFTEIYSRNHRENVDNVISAFQAFNGKLLLSEILKYPHASNAPIYSRTAWISDFRQIAVYIRNIGARSASVTVAYIDKPLSDLNADPDISEWKVCFGYLTIIGFDEYLPMLQGLLNVVRGEFPGDWQAGNSVSTINLHLDGQAITGWVPQVFSQNVTENLDEEDDYHPVSQTPGSFGTFYETEKFDNIRKYLESLTNMYAIW